MRIARLAAACLAWGLTIGTGPAAAARDADAAAVWQQASSRHFVVYAQGTAGEVRDFTKRLERYDRAMHVLRGLDDGVASRARRVTVYVVRDNSAVQRLAGDAGVAGFYIPRASGSVAFTPRTSGDHGLTALSAQAVLLHEYAHHITFISWSHAVLPAWFVEGFAEFNATATFAADGGMTFGTPPYYRAREMLDLHTMPIGTLLTADPNRLWPLQREVFYGRAWLLVHYLTFDEERRRQLSDYLGRINKGQTPKQAATAFGDPAKLDVALNRYARAPKIATLTLKAADLATGEVAVRALTPAEASAMPALLLSSRGVSAKNAGPALEAALAAAKAFPAAAVTQNELAEAEYDAGHYPQSQAAAERAQAADPASIHALMYQGMAAAAMAGKAHDVDAAHWQAIRRSFGKANHIDPDDPWPLEMFYQSYEMAGQPPTANAEDGLLYAYALAPYATDVRLLAAEVYLRRADAARAREAMLPIAYSEHGGPAALRIRDVLATLDKDGAAAALVALKKDPAKDGTQKAT